MFRPAIFDVTGRLESAGELLICFRPPLAGLTPPAAATKLLQRLGDALGALAPEEPASGEGAGIWSVTLPLATLRRKATFSWGWDFGPRLPSIRGEDGMGSVGGVSFQSHTDGFHVSGSSAIPTSEPGAPLPPNGSGHRSTSARSS